MPRSNAWLRRLKKNLSTCRKPNRWWRAELLIAIENAMVDGAKAPMATLLPMGALYTTVVGVGCLRFSCAKSGNTTVRENDPPFSRSLALNCPNYTQWWCWWRSAPDASGSEGLKTDSFTSDTWQQIGSCFLLPKSNASTNCSTYQNYFVSWQERHGKAGHCDKGLCLLTGAHFLKPGTK